MSSHIVIDGNAFYEVDDECMKRRREEAPRQAVEPGEESGRDRGQAGGKGQDS